MRQNLKSTHLLEDRVKIWDYGTSLHFHFLYRNVCYENIHLWGGGVTIHSFISISILQSCSVKKLTSMLVRFTCERPAACPNFFWLWAGPALIFSHQARPSSKLKLSSATSIWSLRSAHAYKHHASAHDQMKEKIRDFRAKIKIFEKST